MFARLNRRTFLARSAGTLAALALVGRPESARGGGPPPPAGPVYGRTGPLGLASGTPSSPSLGPVRLLDGRELMAAHVASRPIGSGKGVLLAPDGGGGWSILYAEV